jgi:hypothetical protein
MVASNTKCRRTTTAADNTLVTDGSEYETLFIDGHPFTLSATASSVDGGAATDCNPDATPGRYLSFALIAE